MSLPFHPFSYENVGLKPFIGKLEVLLKLTLWEILFLFCSNVLFEWVLSKVWLKCSFRKLPGETAIPEMRTGWPRPFGPPSRVTWMRSDFWWVEAGIRIRRTIMGTLLYTWQVPGKKIKSPAKGTIPFSDYFTQGVYEICTCVKEGIKWTRYHHSYGVKLCYFFY